MTQFCEIWQGKNIQDSRFAGVIHAGYADVNDAWPAARLDTGNKMVFK